MRTTAPASRGLQENDIDVYVRLDLLTVKKVTLKIREMDSFFMFLFFILT